MARLSPKTRAAFPLATASSIKWYATLRPDRPSELVDQILLEIRRWQPAPTAGAGRHHAHRDRRHLGLRSRPLEKSRLAVFNQNHAPTAKALASNGVRRVS